jgi:ribosomal protein L37AE/L43A
MRDVSQDESGAPEVNNSTDLKLCPDCAEPRLSNADGVLHCTSCGWSEEDEAGWPEPIPTGVLADMLDDLEHEEQP